MIQFNSNFNITKTKTANTLLVPGTRLLSVSRCALILALRFLSASLWFLKAAMLFSADTPFLSILTVASTSSPLSLSKTKDEVERDPFLVSACNSEFTKNTSLIPSHAEACTLAEFQEQGSIASIGTLTN